MDNEDHATCPIGEDGVLMACRVVEEQFDVVHGVLGGFGLGGCDGTQCSEHCGIYSSAVVEKSAKDLLDVLFFFFQE